VLSLCSVASVRSSRKSCAESEEDFKVLAKHCTEGVGHNGEKMVERQERWHGKYQKNVCQYRR
jgi:hypothetical protein